jgi:hypothetical protein
MESYQSHQSHLLTWGSASSSPSGGTGKQLLPCPQPFPPCGPSVGESMDKQNSGASENANLPATKCRLFAGICWEHVRPSSPDSCLDASHAKDFETPRNVHNMGSRAAQTRMNVESGMPHWLQLQSPFFWNRLYMEEHPVPFLQNPISPLHISEFIPSIRTDILHSDSCSIPCKYPKSIAKEEWAYQTPQWWPMVVGQNYRTSPCLKIIHWWIQWWSIGHGSMQMALARCSLGSTFCSSVSFASTSDVHMVVCNYIMWYLWYICMQTNVKCACIYIYTMTYRVEDMVYQRSCIRYIT